MYRGIKKYLLFLIASALIVPTMYAGEYVGTVTALQVIQRNANLDAAYIGNIRSTARLGEICKPFITKKDSDIVVEAGNNLLELTLPYWIAAIKQAEYQLNGAKIGMDLAKKNLEIYKKLIGPKAESLNDYETYLGAYIEAVKKYKTAEDQVKMNSEMLREVILRAPYQGVISKVFQREGLAYGGNIIEYTQLSPIGITVEMPRSEARKAFDKPVKIVSLNNGIEQGILYGRSMLTDNGITFVTMNYPTSDYLIKDLGIPVERNCSHVEYFHGYKKSSDKNELAVAVTGLQKDEKGIFVWGCTPVANDNQISSKLDSVYTIEKVYVVPSELYRRSNSLYDLQGLKNSGDLKYNQLILDNPSANLKNGDKIFYPNARYEFMPGDKVKVIVGT